MPGNQHLLHLGTIGYGLREFVVMLNPARDNDPVYIEEVVLTNVDFSTDTYASCKYISDDNLHRDLAEYAMEQKLTDIKRVVNTLIDRGKLSWLMPRIDLSK